jgi:glycine cleavage system H lipoate-binding protein
MNFQKNLSLPKRMNGFRVENGIATVGISDYAQDALTI